MDLLLLDEEVLDDNLLALLKDLLLDLEEGVAGAQGELTQLASCLFDDDVDLDSVRASVVA